MNDNKLKPCPNCGDKELMPTYHHVPGRVHYLLCQKCGWSVWGDRDEDNLVDLWNATKAKTTLETEVGTE